jgi:hypothetical protein
VQIFLVIDTTVWQFANYLSCATFLGIPLTHGITVDEFNDR